MKSILQGRDRLLESDRFKDLTAVLEFCCGELVVLECASGGLQSHPRLTDAVLYRVTDTIM